VGDVWVRASSVSGLTLRFIRSTWRLNITIHISAIYTVLDSTVQHPANHADIISSDGSEHARRVRWGWERVLRLRGHAVGAVLKGVGLPPAPLRHPAPRRGHPRLTHGPLRRPRQVQLTDRGTHRIVDYNGSSVVRIHCGRRDDTVAFRIRCYLTDCGYMCGCVCVCIYVHRTWCARWRGSTWTSPGSTPHRSRSTRAAWRPFCADSHGYARAHCLLWLFDMF
jgi:hypothetical protein